MMADHDPCSCVVDTSGLHAIATASSNLQPILFEKLKQGVIGVPACALHEFQELYEEEAAMIAPHITKKIIMRKATYAGAARIADKLNSGFSRGPFDNHAELYTAAIAINCGYHVLTSTDQLGVYKKMDCKVVDLEAFIDEWDY